MLVLGRVHQRDVLIEHRFVAADIVAMATVGAAHAVAPVVVALHDALAHDGVCDVLDCLDGLGCLHAMQCSTLP